MTEKNQKTLRPEWIAPNRTALVINDMQVAFGSPDGEMARRGADVTACQAAVKKAEELTDAARAADVPVVFVRLLTHPGGEIRIMRESKERQGDDKPDLCQEGSRGADFIGPQPRPGEAVFSKNHFSAFARTGLADQLHAQGIDTVVLAGLTTECCVQSSAWNAFEQDFHLFIAEDACAAYEEALHRHALKALQLSAATVAPVNDFVKAWSQINQ
jgi:ureidoacrylate peracid hydrolase